MPLIQPLHLESRGGHFFSLFSQAIQPSLKWHGSGRHISGAARSEPSVRKRPPLPPAAPPGASQIQRAGAKGGHTCGAGAQDQRGSTPIPFERIAPPTPMLSPLPVRGPAATPAVWFLDLLERIRRVGSSGGGVPAIRIAQEGSFTSPTSSRCAHPARCRQPLPR